MCRCHTQPSMLCTISKQHIEMLLLLHYNCSIYYDSRTAPQTESYSRTLEAAAFLRCARSMYLHCIAASSESHMHKGIQSKPR